MGQASPTSRASPGPVSSVVDLDGGNHLNRCGPDVRFPGDNRHPEATLNRSKMTRSGPHSPMTKVLGSRPRDLGRLKEGHYAAARVHRPHCRMAVRCAGAGAGADLSLGWLVAGSARAVPETLVV
jgi:hypothetical protein